MKFGLKTLLAIVTLSCVILFLLAASPGFVASPVLVFVWVTLTSLFMSGLIYGRGNVRAFCAGAMLPAGATTIALTWLLCIWLTTGPYEVKDWSKLLTHLDNLAFSMRVWSGAGWVMIGLVGLTAVAVRIALQPKDSERLDKATESPIEEPFERRSAEFHQPS